MNICEAEREFNVLSQEINKVKAKLKDMPQENIHFSSNGKYTKWIVHDKDNRYTLSRKERSFAVLLAEKKYYSLLLKDLEKEAGALRMFLNHAKDESCLNIELARHSEFREMIENKITIWNDMDKQWMNATYEKNPYKLEELTYKTVSGITVRSKSEGNIASALYKHGIAFRYECKTIINGHIIYPDFIIMHPKTRELVYWEHFGLWDNPDYYNKNHKRLEELYNQGIMQGKNLIVTYETKGHLLSEIEIENRIHEFFL